MDLKHLKLLFLLLSISASSFVLGADVLGMPEIEDFKVYPIEPRSGFEPSGLTIKDGQLFTVSDKSNKIYRIEIKGDVAMMTPYLSFDAIKLGALVFDLEGLTVVDDDFFVVSEAHHRLVRVQPDGQISWVPDGPSFFPEAHKTGLFQVFNASLEAVTYMGAGRFLMAAERQPRGLIEVQLDQKLSQVVWQKNHVLNTTDHALSKDRIPDLTGLFHFKGEVYALHRNAELIHQWVKDESGNYTESKQWSYEHIVNAPDNQYQNTQFGHAEGLAVDDEYFYIVLDNNRGPKAKLKNDARPLLIVIKRND
ncbi:esterase-like activity of phytase family protein [Marinicella rhabdoformis]|uniref:esterase-like activity of phytase family protein n=1 Tax=Marinicella rhabdoformis TaxID=2580566 RepID=UPI0012AEDD99|nr:esterase-like activity of phytase family protein [Marinicella rhabdoformis]